MRNLDLKTASILSVVESIINWEFPTKFPSIDDIRKGKTEIRSNKIKKVIESNIEKEPN